jgi:transcriptional regulator GlxA family with amidase domain
MSLRHFARAFIAETGTTPSKAIERLRIEVARQRAKSSSEAIERVPESTGFSRSRADAPRLHPRLRPAAAIAAPRGAGGLRRRRINQ